MKITKLVTIVVTFVVVVSPFHFLQKILAASFSQTINVCFVTLDNSGNILNSLPGGTNIKIDLFTDPGHLVENKINKYGTKSISVNYSPHSTTNSDLTGDGKVDSYCVKKEFANEDKHEYTYTEALISSKLDWLQTRYNDEIQIKFVDPDIAFPYSNEWFDQIPGNESKRNQNSDGHLTLTKERPNRTVVIVAQLDKNLPAYEVKFGDSIPDTEEFTLSSIPKRLDPNSRVELRFTVQNMGTLKWLSSLNHKVKNPVNVSYHWKNLDTGEYIVYNGNRAQINHNIEYTKNDSNITLPVDVPNILGNYELIIDLVHEGVAWFSTKGASTQNIKILVDSLSSPYPNAGKVSKPNLNGYYIVQAPKPDPGWHCGGYDCYTGIAEDFYQCSAKGIPNYVPNTTNINVLQKMCWWQIYNVNKHLYNTITLPPEHKNAPWNYVEVGWLLIIPNIDGGGNPTASNFSRGIPSSSKKNPYGGMNGAHSPWPEVTFDRWIKWDGSEKFDELKKSETRWPVAPTITSIVSSSNGKFATIYGVAIPKNLPMHVKVWNEFRYGWARGSDWEFHYQQGKAQHVQVVLFKNNWQYLGDVWNDNPNGRWSIKLPVGSKIKSGDYVFAEVRIYADFTFHNLKWWHDTYESRNFNLRDPKYTDYPYFGSGGGNPVVVPLIYVDKRSEAEKVIDAKANKIGAKKPHKITKICGVPAKRFDQITQGDGAIFYVNRRAIYIDGGLWDTYASYTDKCKRFGIPTNDPYKEGGSFSFRSYQNFSKGKLFWNWKYKGKFVYGKILNTFEISGGIRSNYRWPTSDIYDFNENGKNIKCQNFESGPGKRICEEGIFTNIKKYCESYRNGSTTEAGYEQNCGTLLQNGKINLPNVNVTTRKEWGAKYSQESADPYTYNYFYRYNVNSLDGLLNTIVIHHTGDPLNQSVQDLEDKEKNSSEGYQSMPYHFIIGQNGTIYEGRPLEFVGDHSTPNYGRIGIVLTGDFEPRLINAWNPDNPTDEQIISLKKLVNDLENLFKVDTEKILGHNQLNSTDCPGDKLETYLAEIKKYTRNY